MLDVRLPELRPFAFDGNFGLEREALRVTTEGRMAHTPHPFPSDHPRIVRDFCENQTEINTRVWPTADEAVAELRSLNAEILSVLGGRVSSRADAAAGDSRPPAEALRAAHDALRAKLLPQVYSLGFLNPDVEYFE